jgi:hypothetical protein
MKGNGLNVARQCEKRERALRNALINTAPGIAKNILRHRERQYRVSRKVLLRVLLEVEARDNIIGKELLLRVAAFRREWPPVDQYGSRN